jgi:hypothetical protein
MINPASKKANRSCLDFLADAPDPPDSPIDSLTESSRALSSQIIDTKLMEMLFRRALCLPMFASVLLIAPAHSDGVDRLDDAAEVQLQQSLNDVYNRYNPEIANLQIEADQLRATGYQQCELEGKAAEGEAKQTESDAKMQALQGMLGPGAQTVGHLVDAGMKGASKEKQSKEQQLQRTIATCQSTGTLDCSSVGADPLPVNETTCPGSTANPSLAMQCRQNASTEALRYTERIATINKDIKDSSGAMDGLMKSGMELAAAGIGGMMINKQGKEMAEYLRDNAEGQVAACKNQVAAQISGLANQIKQLEAAKQRDLLMANMMAEYQTKVRREQKPQNIEETLPNEDLGGTIGFGATPFTPLPDAPIKSVPFGQNTAGGAGNPAAGAGGGGGPGGGGAATAPPFDFNSGNGFDGGSRLPDQPDGLDYAGTAVGSLSGGKGGAGGFGALDGKDLNTADGDRGLASEDGGVLGDGGLRVLLARTSLVHMRHAPTLRKSVDFDRLAKSQGIQPQAVSTAPISPN